MTELLPVWMLVVLAGLLFSGYPAAFVLMGVAVLFAGIGVAIGEISPAMLKVYPIRVYGLFADNLVFPAIPPLILMGSALARSGLATNLFNALAHLMRRVPGNLAIATLLVGLLIAPSAGLTGAAVGILALAAMPAMEKAGYTGSLSAAAVGASGTLGVILPPAIMLFFLAELIEVPIIGMFTGILAPALALAVGYVAYFILAAPSAVKSDDASTATLVTQALPPVLLIGAVIAAIITGFATPSQSGSLGAAGALLLMALNGTMTRASLHDVLTETGLITAMICLLIVGANAFSLVFRLLDGDTLFATGLAKMALGPWGTLLVILGVIFVLGLFIDWIEIVLITLPIFGPVLAKLDFAAHVGGPLLVKVWIGVAVAIVLQTSFLTPPFGFALFYLRASAPESVRMTAIYRGAVPIVAIQLIVLTAVLLLPSLVTWFAAKSMS